MKAFYNSYQKNKTSCDSYMDSTTKPMDVIVHFSSILEDHLLLINNKLKEAGVGPLYVTDVQQIETAKSESKDAYTVVAFLFGLNQNSYGQLMNDLHNTFRMGRYEYHTYPTTDYDLSKNWKGNPASTAVSPNNGVAFLTKNKG